MSNKRKIQRHLAAVATSATKQDPGAFCECGWQLPTNLNIKFENPADAPVSGSGVGVELACPVCGHVYSGIFGKTSVPSLQGAGPQDRIRCIEATGADCTDLPSPRMAA